MLTCEGFRENLNSEFEMGDMKIPSRFFSVHATLYL